MNKIFIVINNPVCNYLEIMFSSSACQHVLRQRQTGLTMQVVGHCSGFAAQSHRTALLRFDFCDRQRS